MYSSRGTVCGRALGDSKVIGFGHWVAWISLSLSDHLIGGSEGYRTTWSDGPVLGLGLESSSSSEVSSSDMMEGNACNAESKFDAEYMIAMFVDGLRGTIFTNSLSFPNKLPWRMVGCGVSRIVNVRCSILTPVLRRKNTIRR